MGFFLWSVCVWVCVGLEDIWITFTESEWHTGPIPDTWFTNKFTIHVLNLHYIIFPSQQIRNPWLTIGKMRLHVLHRISKISFSFCEILRINVQYCKESSRNKLTNLQLTLMNTCNVHIIWRPNFPWHRETEGYPLTGIKTYIHTECIYFLAVVVV